MAVSIGKLKIKNTEELQKWLSSDDSTYFFKGNWSKQHSLWEKAKEKIGFYELQTEIPYLHKALDNMDSSWRKNELIEIATYYETIGQQFHLIYNDPRFVIFEGAKYLYILPTYLCDITLYEDYSNKTLAALKSIGNEQLSLSPALLNDTSMNDIVNKIDSKKTEIEEKEKELAELKKKQEAELEEFKRMLDKKYADAKELMQKKMDELNEVKEQLEKQMFVLESEIYAIRCYTGEVVDFVKLTDGKKADITEPLVVYQKIRYLDEELGKALAIYDFDGDDTKYFEDIIKNRSDLQELFIPGEKSVALIQISKSGKGYGANQFIANMLDEYEKYHGKTIAILVKNGENVYIGWTDEEKIKINDDNVFFVPKADSVADESQKSSSGKERLSRYFIFTLLQGICDSRSLIELPEKINVTVPSPHIIYSSADGWIENDKYGTFQDIIEHTNAPLKKGDYVLTVQQITRDDYNAFTGKYSRYDRYNNDRGRGEKNRTHDVSLRNCMVYPINLIDNIKTYQLYMLKYPAIAKERIVSISSDGTCKWYTYDKELLQGPPHLVENRSFEIENGKEYGKTSIEKKYGSVDDYFKSIYSREDIIITQQKIGENCNNAYQMIYHHCELIFEKEKAFISCAKNPNWETGKSANANFEIMKDEYLNLTYLNSIYVKYAITNRKIGVWYIGGTKVDYAYSLKYLNKALQYLEEREVEEAQLLEKYMTLYNDWQVDLSEWRLKHGYHSLTDTRAKAFAKAHKEK